MIYSLRHDTPKNRQFPLSVRAEDAEAAGRPGGSSREGASFARRLRGAGGGAWREGPWLQAPALSVPNSPRASHLQSHFLSLATFSLMKVVHLSNTDSPSYRSFTETCDFLCGVHTFVLRYLSGSPSAGHTGRNAGGEQTAEVQLQTPPVPNPLSAATPTGFARPTPLVHLDPHLETLLDPLLGL